MLRSVAQRLIGVAVQRRGVLGTGIAACALRCVTQPAAAAEPAGSLRGKKAIVFGGTSGIGLATSLLLREEGASVVAVSRDPSKVVGAAREQLDLAACDVQDRAALSALFQEHGPADIIVSAATGGDRALGPFLTMDIEGYKGSFAKLWGYANVVQCGAPHLAPDGCIVLVSGAPARKPKPGQASLASVGAAVEQLARTVAPELAPRRINVVSPGITAG